MGVELLRGEGLSVVPLRFEKTLPGLGGFGRNNGGKNLEISRLGIRYVLVRNLAVKLFTVVKRAILVLLAFPTRSSSSRCVSRSDV